MERQVFDIHGQMEDDHWWFVGRRRIIQGLLRDLLAGVADPMVVEIGCGTGGVIGSLVDEYRCVGIDLDDPAIELARAKYPRCQYVCGTFPADLPVAPEDADAFLVCDVLEHIEDDDGFLATLCDVARPGAQILVTVPAGRDLWSEHDVAARHHRRYEADELGAKLARLPLKVRLLSPYNSRLYWPIWSVRQVTRRLGLTLGQGGTDFSMPPKPVNDGLADLFGGEKAALRRAVDASRPAYARGVSLIAALERV